MSSEEYNLGNISLDMVIVIMKKVLEDGFASFFNLFKVWGQTKKASEIIQLLEYLPVCDLYQFRLVGNDTDVACFDRFFSIVEGLQIADAVLYRRVHDLLSGVGNVYVKLMELDVLASRGHFLSMVAALAFRFLSQKDVATVSITPCLVQLYRQPNFDSKFCSSVTCLQNIRDVVVAEGCLSGSGFCTFCPIHHPEMDSNVQYAVNRDCLLCDIAVMSNVFRKP